MDIKKSKVVCILLLNMIDAELSRVIDYELDDDNEKTNHAELYHFQDKSQEKISNTNH